MIDFSGILAGWLLKPNHSVFCRECLTTIKRHSFHVSRWEVPPLDTGVLAYRITLPLRMRPGKLDPRCWQRDGKQHRSAPKKASFAHPAIYEPRLKRTLSHNYCRVPKPHPAHAEMKLESSLHAGARGRGNLGAVRLVEAHIVLECSLHTPVSF